MSCESTSAPILSNVFEVGIERRFTGWLFSICRGDSMRFDLPLGLSIFKHKVKCIITEDKFKCNIMQKNYNISNISEKTLHAKRKI